MRGRWPGALGTAALEIAVALEPGLGRVDVGAGMVVGTTVAQLASWSPTAT